MGWSDLIRDFIGFLSKPTGLGVIVILVMCLLVMFLAPIGVLTYINIDGTNRIVGAIHELKGSLPTRNVANRY